MAENKEETTQEAAKEPNVFFVCFRLAEETRKAQKAYFADRTSTNLVISKECEKALDDQIKKIREIAKEKGVQI